MSERLDYLVIGAGIVGLATARTLQRARPDARLAVIDKAGIVAAHQSSHNSGVIHAGVYYEPGSMKARFCRAGVEATTRFCETHGVPYRRCGKLIVATDAMENERLQWLHERARQNGLACEMLDAAALRALEPEVDGVAALQVAATGIADYPALCRQLAALVIEDGGTIHLDTEAQAITESANAVHVETRDAHFDTAKLVVCGGLQADRLAGLAGIRTDIAIVPFRGDYYRMPRSRSDFVSTLIYPVPDPALPFLGVHLTLTTDGGITIGPTAMLAFAREVYAKWAVNPRDAADLARFAGTWRLLRRFPRAGFAELVHAVSRQTYLRAARRYCPGLTAADLDTHACGIRAQAVSRAGEIVQDFRLESTPRSLHVLNAPSPAATSAFPIAEAIVARVVD